MNISKNFRYKSLLVCIMAVIFLYSAMVFGVFPKTNIGELPVTVTADEEPAYTEFTVKSEIPMRSVCDVTLTIDGLSDENEVEPRVYGDPYNAVTATAVETVSGNEISGYGYVIQYNDETMSGAWTTTVPVNAGRYTVRAYGAATATYNEAISDVAYLTINPRTLEINFIDDYKISNTEGGTRPYNGEPYRIRAVFTNVLAGDSVVPITGGGNQVNASDTPYKFNVYGFSAGNTATKNNYYTRNVSYPYLITRVPMTVVWSDLEHAYDGTQKDPTVTWENGSVVPSDSPIILSGTRVNAGSHTVTAEYNGADKDNFTILNDIETLTIDPKELLVFWTDVNGGQKTYDGTVYEIGVSFGNVVFGDTVIPIVTGEDGINASDTLYVKTVTGFTTEGDTLAENYVLCDTNREYLYAITKREVTVSWSNTSLTYSAVAQKPTATWTDGVALNTGSSLVVTGERINASNTPYTATVTISGADAANFTITNNTQNFTIGKATATVVWSNLTHTYDGTQKNPAAAWANGSVVPEGSPQILSGTRVNAGSYTVTSAYYGADKDNFNVNNLSASLTINKAKLWISLSGSAVYGQEAVLFASINTALSDQVPASERDMVNAKLDSVTLATDCTSTTSPSTRCYVIVEGHNQSTYVSDSLLQNYRFEFHKAYFYPAKANIISIEWSEDDYTYNATAQTITATGTNQYGDTMVLEITVNREFKHAANDYTATAAVSATDSEYFEFGDSVVTSKNYTMKRATATVVWSDLTHTYDGTQKNPDVAWDTAELTPEGEPEVAADERINAGSHTVTAEYNGVDKDNFTILNASNVLTINKKEITSSELDEWINNGDAVFNGQTVVYDGNLHMIYAHINGSASDIITVGEYLVDGNPFNGASEVSDYNVIAVIAPVNGNYTAEGLTLSATLRIYENIDTGHDAGSGTLSTGGDGDAGGVSSGAADDPVSETVAVLYLIIVIIATVFGFIAILVIVKKFHDEIA